MASARIITDELLKAIINNNLLIAKISIPIHQTILAKIIIYILSNHNELNYRMTRTKQMYD